MTKHQQFVRVAYGHGSVFLWQHCDMLCISGFVDDVMFHRIATWWTAIEHDKHNSRDSSHISLNDKD